MPSIIETKSEGGGATVALRTGSLPRTRWVPWRELYKEVQGVDFSSDEGGPADSLVSYNDVRPYPNARPYGANVGEHYRNLRPEIAIPRLSEEYCVHRTEVRIMASRGLPNNMLYVQDPPIEEWDINEGDDEGDNENL
jgi:hypothetical protein